MPSILVVEDSPTQAAEIRHILESQGFEVAVSLDGQTALAELARARFDLVISDILMPGLSGYDLCRRLKIEPQTRKIPVVLLTQLSEPLDILQGLECGADNFITKPFTPEYLAGRIGEILLNQARRADDKPEEIPLTFRGRGVIITSDKQQILDLLLATVEEFVRERDRTRRLEAARDQAQRQAAELAEAARRKDDFLAMLAHELRNPLAAVVSALELARQDGVEPDRREWALKTAERQALRLSQLLDDLLEASRLSRGCVRLRTQRLDLTALVRATAEDQRHVLERAGLSLTVHAPQKPVWIQGDPVRLAQTLDNLLDNARKFSSKGGQVSVRLQADLSPGRTCLTVSDTGMGIEAGQLERVFDVFTQADRSLGRPRGGLGLGLAVVKALVELHGGNVRAASAGPGMGAEFTIQLPVEPEPAS